MSTLDADLQHLEEIYSAIERALRQPIPDFGPEPWLLPEHYEPAMPLEQVKEAGRLAERITERWQSCGPTSEQRAAWEAQVSRLCNRLQKVLAMAESHAMKFRQLQSSVRTSLEQLQSGKQFLYSMRPCKENRPKFIDARQ
jgi:hypothetical protein